MRRGLLAVGAVALLFTTGCPHPTPGPTPSPTTDEQQGLDQICFDGGTCVDPPTADDVETKLKDLWAAQSAQSRISGDPYPIQATFDPATEVLPEATWDSDGIPDNGDAGEVPAWPVRVWAVYLVDKQDGSPEDDTFYAGCRGHENTVGDTQDRIIYMVPDESGGTTPHIGAESDDITC